MGVFTSWLECEKVRTSREQKSKLWTSCSLQPLGRHSRNILLVNATRWQHLGRIRQPARICGLLSRRIVAVNSYVSAVCLRLIFRLVAFTAITRYSFPKDTGDRKNGRKFGLIVAICSFKSEFRVVELHDGFSGCRKAWLDSFERPCAVFFVGKCCSVEVINYVHLIHLMIMNQFLQSKWQTEVVKTKTWQRRAWNRGEKRRTQKGTKQWEQRIWEEWARFHSSSQRSVSL